MNAADFDALEHAEKNTTNATNAGKWSIDGSLDDVLFHKDHVLCDSVIAASWRVTASSSTNAVGLSSARTTKRFPSSQCASAIQMVRPSASTAETQPQLQPAKIVSDYF